MAPNYSVQIFKHAYSQRPISNVYLIEASDLDDATAQGNALIAGEIAFHYNVVTFDRVRVSSLAEADDVFAITPSGLPGELDGGGDDFLPLFNRVRVDFAVDGGGRPSRKYYMLPVAEGVQAGGTLSPGFVTAFNGSIAAFLSDLGTAGVNWQDPDGQAIVSGVTFGDVAMRQLHRKRRRIPAP